LTVEAGCTLRDAQRAAAEAGLLFPLSMGSEETCQLGGVLSTNAGGLAVLRYGTARELVLGLEVVLPDGRILDGLSALRKNNTGYDLKQLFLGAEGTLGVITAAVLKLFPRPHSHETVLLAVTNLRAACEVLVAVRATLGDCVTSFEFVTHEALGLVLRHLPDSRAPFGGAVTHFVLLELSVRAGDTHLRSAVEALHKQLLDDGVVQDGLVATNESQRAAWWRLRERIPAAERAAGGSVKHDVSVEIGDLAQLTESAAAAVKQLVPNSRCSIYGHIGDGNLHFNVLAADGADPLLFREQHAAAISDAVHRCALALGGSFSAEHGVGQLKRGLLRQTKSPVALDLMMRLKASLDPKGLMNPGKML
jgi:FAD/FMN-containing dehydrogenase